MIEPGKLNGYLVAIKEELRKAEGKHPKFCDELKPLVFSISCLAYVDEPTPQPNFQNPHDHAVYKATEVDAAIAELKKEILNLEAKNIKLQSFYDLHENVDNYIDKLKAENAGLKDKLETVNELIKTARQMLEDAKATHYAEMVDAGMENRRLKRALWMSRADRAHKEVILFRDFSCLVGKEFKWRKVEKLCRAKAEEFK